MAIAGIATITRSTRVNLDCRFKSWYHCLIVRKVHPPFLSSHFLSVLRGGKSGILLEALSEVIAIAVAYLGRDVCNLISGVGEQLLGFFHAELRKILIQSLSSLIFKEGTHIGSGQKYMVADILHRQGLVHVLLANVIFDHENCGVFFRCIVHCLEKGLCFADQLLMEFAK